MARPVEQWMQVFGKLPSPNAPEYDCAQRIIGDLIGYRHNSIHRDNDAKELANAMIAFTRMCQEAGLKV